jgi:divalent metal cation (Fe/Co/Zn/Cd) transporter
MKNLGWLILSLGLFALGLQLGYNAAYATITKAQVVTATKADRK